MLLEIEQWRPCPGFEDCYSISDQGRVRRVKTGKVLKPRPDKDGYQQINLYRSGQFTRKIHRLVAQAFIDNPDEFPEVNHIKGKEKRNNAVSNLEWTTRKGNAEHASEHGLYHWHPKWKQPEQAVS